MQAVWSTPGKRRGLATGPAISDQTYPASLILNMDQENQLKTISFVFPLFGNAIIFQIACAQGFNGFLATWAQLGAFMRKRFAQDRRGATAVEFALLMPILIVIAFGAIEFGLIFYCHTSAGYAAWNTTRQLATNRIKITDVDTTARDQLPSWMRASATIIPSATSADPFVNRYTVTIAFPATAASTTSVIGWAYSTLILTSQTTMMQEPLS